jgi:hypothetical protein
MEPKKDAVVRDDPKPFVIGTFVRWSQLNGVVCHGEVLAYASWDSPDDVVLVRHYWNPQGDAALRSYRLVKSSLLSAGNLPEGFVKGIYL